MGGRAGKAGNLVVFIRVSKAPRIEAEFINIISGQTPTQKGEMKKFIKLWLFFNQCLLPLVAEDLWESDESYDLSPERCSVVHEH